MTNDAVTADNQLEYSSDTGEYARERCPARGKVDGCCPRYVTLRHFAVHFSRCVLKLVTATAKGCQQRDATMIRLTRMKHRVLSALRVSPLISIPLIPLIPLIKSLHRRQLVPFCRLYVSFSFNLPPLSRHPLPSLSHHTRQRHHARGRRHSR